MAADKKPSIIERVAATFGFIKAADLPPGEYTLDQIFERAGPYHTGRRYLNQREQLEAYVDWVYAAASAIAQDASTIELRAFANRGKASSGRKARALANDPPKAWMGKDFIARRRELEELDNHILLDLLEKPNPAQDADNFKEMTFLHLVLSGEAFWAILRNNLGKPAELWPMMPYQMFHKIENRNIVSWTYRIGGEEIVFDPADIVHIKLTDPTNLYRGTGVVKAAARAINTGNAATAWNETFFINSARPDVALETEGKLDKEVVERLREQWQERFGGTSKAHKVAVLDQGLKVSRITTTQKEMDFLESLKYNRDQQLAMFKTSRTMLGIVEGDGRSNMEAAEYNQAKRVIRPLDRRLVAAINHSLAPDFDPKLVIGFTDPVPEDKEFDHKQRVESVNVYRTVNEVRAEDGLEPVSGGDVIYVGGGLVPLGTSPTPPPDTDDTVEDDETKATPVGGKKKASIALTTSAKS